MKRMRYTVIISATRFPYEQALEYLTPHLGQKFAGASCRPVDGIWSTEGHLFQAQYDHVVQEPGMQITISVLPEHATLAYQQIRSMLQSLKKDIVHDIDWVHVECEEIECKHFQLME